MLLGGKPSRTEQHPCSRSVSTASGLQRKTGTIGVLKNPTRQFRVESRMAGGQTRPGNLCNNDANTQVTDELLAHDYFRRMAMFANREFQPSIIYTTL